MTQPIIKSISKTIRETCPVCRNDYGKKEEKFKIIAYGCCSSCLLEKQLGHPYRPNTWDCVCVKKFMSKKNLDKHALKFRHLQVYLQTEIK